MDTTAKLTREEIHHRVVKTMNEILGISSERISEHSRLAEDFGADSLDAVEIVMALEEQFGTRFEDIDRKQVHTVGDIVNYVNRQLAAPISLPEQDPPSGLSNDANGIL